MSDFELIYQAAKKRDAKTISLIFLHRSLPFEPVKDFALTPAGLCAQEGDWDTANWLVTEFNASVGSILYGAVLGGHITEWANPKEIISKLLKGPFKHKLFWECKAHLLQAFAQMGMLSVIEQYFQDHTEAHSELISSALGAAIYSNQIAVIDFLFKKFDSEPWFLKEAIKSAAWANNRELLQDYLKQYHQIHKLHPHELNDNIAEYLMRGCGSGGHVDLFGFLIQTYPNISTRDCIYYGFKSAIYHQKNDFIISLCQQYPKTIEDAKNAMAAMGRPDIIEQLPPCPHEYSGIAIFSEYWFRDASSAKKYLSKFTQPENIDKLCAEIEKRPEIDKLVLKELPRIKEYALKIIDFKARYAVTTAQATLLCEHPDIFELILTSKYRGKEKELFALIADNTVLDFWQFNELIERMPRAQLIIDLEHYLKNKTSWWYNHRGRCKSFLGVIKKTTDPKQCQQLVTAQIKLFAPESPPKPVKEAPRYASEVKQVTVKDGYYEALLKFQQQQFDEEEYQPSNTLTP